MDGKLLLGIALLLVLGAVGISMYMTPAEKVYRIEAPFQLMGEPQSATSEAPQSVELTVYQVDAQNYYYPTDMGKGAGSGYDANTGVALIKETRKSLFPQGPTAFNMKGTAQYLDSTSLHLKDLTDGSTQVIEQNYNYDLVNQEKLLQKYVDKNVDVVTEKGVVSGKLLSSANGLVLQTKDGITSLNEYKQVNFPSLPEGLMTVPTINWLLNSQTAGEHQIQASYLASGLNWHADYVAIANADDSKLDLQGWVSLQNHAGATFTDAKLKLVAGEINLVRPNQPKYYAADSMAREALAGAAPSPQFTQENLFEYHLYTLSHPTTLKDNEDKQISLLEGTGVPVKKQLVFDSEKSSKVQVKLEFDNKKENGLGMPMPKGKVRVYKADSDGQLQFLGEDAVDHTPQDENVRLSIGSAFDVIAEQKQADYRQNGQCGSEVSYTVDVRNHKKEAVSVQVMSPTLGGEWSVTKESQAHVKEDSHHASWMVQVPADGTVSLSYSVRQEYC